MKIIKKALLLYLFLINFLLKPKNAKIPFFKKVLFLLSILLLAFIQPLLNLSIKTSLILYFVLLFLTSLYFISKQLRNQEEMDIYHGFLKLEYQVFKGIDLMFSSFVAISFLILFFISLTLFLLNINHFYNNILINQNSLTILQELKAIFQIIINLIPLINNLNIQPQITLTTLGINLIYILKIAFYIIIFITIRNYIQKLRFEKKLLNSIEDKNSKADIPIIQQRIALLPNSFKLSLLQIISNTQNNPIIIRRAINILFYSKTLSFPKIFLYNLHKYNNDIQKLGLKKSIELLQDKTLIFTQEDLKKLKKMLIFQKKKKYHQKITQLLQELEKVLK